jgi:hypothetical protein
MKPWIGLHEFGVHNVGGNRLRECSLGGNGSGEYVFGIFFGSLVGLVSMELLRMDWTSMVLVRAALMSMVSVLAVWWVSIWVA